MTESYVEIPYRALYEYLFSYGGLSRFFREVIDNQQLMGTKCPKCGKVYCPPRTHCGECYSDTEWVPLPHTGTVEAATYIMYAPVRDPIHKYVDLPYVAASIRLDGADTPLVSMVFIKDVVLGQVKRGMRVKAVFREKREGRLTDFYFVPA